MRHLTFRALGERLRAPSFLLPPLQPMMTMTMKVKSSQVDDDDGADATARPVTASSVCFWPLHMSNGLARFVGCAPRVVFEQRCDGR